MKVISISNQKGGVAKSTTTLNLGYALSIKGKSVLLIDLDPQASLSMCFGISDSDTDSFTISNLFEKVLNAETDETVNTEAYVKKHERNRLLSIIPSNIGLTMIEERLRSEVGSEKTLATVLKPLQDKYDYVIIDTSPSLGLLSLNALAAADEVIITASPQFLSAIGIKSLLQTIRKTQTRINSKLSIAGVLLTMCDSRTNLFKHVREILEKAYGADMRIFAPVIPSSVRVGEANLNQQSIIEYDSKHPASIAYTELAEEVE